MKSKISYITSYFIIPSIMIFVGYQTTNALVINKEVQDLTAFIQKIIYTDNGTPTGNSKISISAVGGSNGHGYIYGSGDLWIGKGNGDTLYVNASLDRVGVNTASPEYSLDVVGGIRSSQHLYVGGKVGIGTTNVDSNNAKLKIVNNTNNAEINLHTANGNGYGHWGIYHAGGAGENQFRIRGNNEDRFTITSNGSVGLGTNNPSYKMHVIGNIYATQDGHFGGNGSIGGTASIGGNTSIGGSATVNGTIQGFSNGIIQGNVSAQMVRAGCFGNCF